MTSENAETIAVVLPCADLDATVAFFVERLGLRLTRIFPADDPAVAELEGRGVRLRLERGRAGEAGVLRIRRQPSDSADATGVWTAPNGTRVEWVEELDLEIPPLRPAFVLTRQEDAGWVTGRAGMRYRDLIPGRLGGRFIASHIRIEEGGAVPDYVHFHDVRLQLIFCVAGWVEVVYQDQGPPFVMRPGDCVLQPPEIRHRVLRCSPGLEVVEVGCPASHPTGVDHDLALPTATARSEREFGGQRFARTIAAPAAGDPDNLGKTGPKRSGDRDLGIADATAGLAQAMARSLQPGEKRRGEAAAEFHFVFLLSGGLGLTKGRELLNLTAGDAYCLPPDAVWEWEAAENGCEVFEVTLP